MLAVVVVGLAVVVVELAVVIVVLAEKHVIVVVWYLFGFSYGYKD